MEINPYQKEEFNSTNSKIEIETLITEVLESITQDEVLDLARLYLLGKYTKYTESELLAEYVRFNGIETKAELADRLKQF